MAYPYRLTSEMAKKKLCRNEANRKDI